MGLLISVFLDLLDLVAITSFDVEAIVSGDAAAIVASQIAAQTVLESAELTEVLSSFGLTEASYAALSSFPTAFQEAVDNVLLLQTLSGLSSYIAVGLSLQTYEIPDTNMALQIWTPDILDEIIPGYRQFQYYLDVLSGWGQSLVRTVGRAFWEAVIDETTSRLQRIGSSSLQAAENAGLQTVENVRQAIVTVVENARWAIRTPVNIYGSLSDYYSRLPGLNPAQLRELNSRLQSNAHNIQIDSYSAPDSLSGQYIERPQSYSGINMRPVPDWLLPLILGILGDLSPFFEEIVEEVENGSKKKI